MYLEVYVVNPQQLEAEYWKYPNLGFLPLFMFGIFKMASGRPCIPRDLSLVTP